MQRRKLGHVEHLSDCLPQSLLLPALYGSRSGCRAAVGTVRNGRSPGGVSIRRTNASTTSSGPGVSGALLARVENILDARGIFSCDPIIGQAGLVGRALKLL